MSSYAIEMKRLDCKKNFFNYHYTHAHVHHLVVDNRMCEYANQHGKIKLPNTQFNYLINWEMTIMSLALMKDTLVIG